MDHLLLFIGFRQNSTYYTMKQAKYLFFVAVLIGLFSINHTAQAQKRKRKKKSSEDIQWVSFAQLEQVMKKQPKYIFIEVETDWCVYCKMLNKTTFTKNKVITALNQDFYALKLNAEHPQEIRFGGQKYPFITQSNGKGIQGLALALKAQSYPSLLILSPDYQILHRHNGYIKAKKLAPLLSYLGKEKYKKQSWKEFILEYKKQRGK